jgi:hypothetical protein
LNHVNYKEQKGWFTRICRTCLNVNHRARRIELIKENFYGFKPAPHFIRQAVIGHKDEPYYKGEDFEYKAPTLTEVLNEYK